MCAMALRLVLVFRPVSPLSGHSHVWQDGGAALPCVTTLGPVHHTRLELESQTLFSLHPVHDRLRFRIA